MSGDEDLVPSSEEGDEGVAVGDKGGADDDLDFGWSPYLERFDQFWWDEDRRHFVTFTRYVHREHEWTEETDEYDDEAARYGSNSSGDGVDGGDVENGEEEEKSGEEDGNSVDGEDTIGIAADEADEAGRAAAAVLAAGPPSGLFRIVMPHGGGVNPRAGFDLPSDIFHTYERDVRGARFSQCLRLCAVLRSGTTVDVLVRKASPDTNSLVGSIKCGRLGLGNLFLTDGMVWGPSRRRDTRAFGTIELALVGVMETAIVQVSGPVGAPEVLPLRHIPSAHVENFWTQSIVRGKPSRGLILWLATLAESSGGKAAETTVKILLSVTSSERDDDRQRRRGPAACVSSIFTRLRLGGG
jgi:hypothetical protein